MKIRSSNAKNCSELEAAKMCVMKIRSFLLT